jgi:hypothetical protein
MSMSYDEGWVRRGRRFISETFGVRGSKNITAWVLAGVAAYYLFYLPEQQRVLEIQVGLMGTCKQQLLLMLQLCTCWSCCTSTTSCTG